MPMGVWDDSSCGLQMDSAMGSGSGCEGEGEGEVGDIMGGLGRRRAFLLVGDDVLVDGGGGWEWLVAVAATMCNACDECGAAKAGEMGKGGAFSSQLSVSTIRWKGSERKGPSRMWPGRFGGFW